MLDILFQQVLALETATHSLTDQLTSSSSSPLYGALTRRRGAEATALQAPTGFALTLIGTIFRVEHALFRLAHLNKKTLFHFRELSISSVI
jgi:hypothetical protein